MTRKSETNEELIVRLMNYSPAGGLAQVFIIEAIRRYANECTLMADELRVSMKDGLIHPEAWIVAANHIQRELNNR